MLSAATDIFTWNLLFFFYWNHRLYTNNIRCIAVQCTQSGLKEMYTNWGNERQEKSQKNAQISKNMQANGIGTKWTKKIRKKNKNNEKKPTCTYYEAVYEASNILLLVLVVQCTINGRYFFFQCSYSDNSSNSIGVALPELRLCYTCRNYAYAFSNVNIFVSLVRVVCFALRFNLYAIQSAVC